jgi:hypothetical protein
MGTIGIANRGMGRLFEGGYYYRILEEMIVTTANGISNLGLLELVDVIGSPVESVQPNNALLLDATLITFSEFTSRV